MTDGVPGLPGTWWTYYTDTAGHCAVLTISVVRGTVQLVTSAGERLLFSPVELGMLVGNLECAAAEVTGQP